MKKNTAAKTSAPKLRLAKLTIKDLSSLAGVVGGGSTSTCNPDEDTRIVGSGSTRFVRRF